MGVNDPQVQAMRKAGFTEEEIACCHPCCDRDTLALDYDYLGDYTDAQAEVMGYDTY